MKRFTETNKWRDPWWRKLSGSAKLLQGYLWDNCDVIGLIEVDFQLISADCGQLIEEKHVTELGDRVQSLGANRYFLPKFINFQYGELTPTCPPHRPIIKLVESHKLVRVGLHYAYPTCIDVCYPNARVALPLRQDKTRKERTGTSDGSKFQILRDGLNALFDRSPQARWMYDEEAALVEVAKREGCVEELADLRNYERSNGKYFPKSIVSLLSNWTKHLDAAKAHQREQKNYERTTHKIHPRNIGIIIGPTNYATAKPRLQREREERERAEKAALAGQVAPTQNHAPATGNP